MAIKLNIYSLSAIILIGILSFSNTFCSQADSNINSDEIFEKAKKFRGVEFLNLYSDIGVNGKIIEKNGNLNELNYFFLKPDKHRLRLHLGNFMINITLSNDAGWAKLPGMPTIPIDDISRHNMESVSLAFFPKIFVMQDRDSMFYSGIEKISGIGCFKFVLIDKKGIYHDFFFAENDFRLVKYLTMKEMNLEPLLFEAYYDKYNDFNGVKFPTEIEVYSGDRELKFKIENVNYNIGLTESDFGKPN
ncbi:MAG: hypothetical protein KIT33_00605 [Candidatus Kapabacteria bacterium]|nr:hypothetical protein [Ignavibacteriota bacterium]MCW5883447.1 hypothetical protein [Candidatus Kapabacteria bacterium]